jgi:hypothetical protein
VSSACRRQVEAALAAVGTDAAGRPTWLGRPIPSVPNVDGDGERRTEALSAVLYRSFYCRGGDASADVPLSSAGPGERRRLLESLVASLPDRDRWDAGWRFLGREGGALVVEKRGLELRASSTEWRFEDQQPPIPGSRGRLRVPVDRWDSAPGFLLVHGQRTPSADPEVRRLRVYLDLDLDGAHGLLEATGGWNSAGLPFVVKVVADPRAYGRCDTVVVVLAGSDFDRAWHAILASADVWADGLRPPTPAFARRIAPGVAVADDPPDGASFGKLRCSQLAEGIARADREGAGSRAERLEIVAGLFADVGASLDALHLGPASPEYDLRKWWELWRRP